MYLEGWLTGLIFKSTPSIKAPSKASFYIASLACPLLNTLLFMSSLVIFFYNTEYIQGFAQAFGATNPFMFVIAFVGVRGAIEAVICFVVGSILTRTLYKILKAGGVKMNQQNLFFNEIDVNTATNGTLGFKLGHAADNKAKTGVSVIYFPDGCKRLAAI